MYSDMSKRTRLFSLPNRKPASARATSVLPTPVGPRKRNEPAGRLLDFKPARDRRMARASAEMAFSWLMTRLCSSSSMRSSLVIFSSFLEGVGAGAGRRGDGFFLADGAFVHFLFDAQQLGDFLLFEGGQGDAGPARHDV